jgi:hypothetical protein
MLDPAGFRIILPEFLLVRCPWASASRSKTMAREEVVPWSMARIRCCAHDVYPLRELFIPWRPWYGRHVLTQPPARRLSTCGGRVWSAARECHQRFAPIPVFASQSTSRSVNGPKLCPCRRRSARHRRSSRHRAIGAEQAADVARLEEGILTRSSAMRAQPPYTESHRRAGRHWPSRACPWRGRMAQSFPSPIPPACGRW